MRCLTLLLLIPTAASADVAVTIDNSRPHQTMQGFGATTMSLVYDGADNVKPALRPLALDAVYNQVKLNMGNLEVEPFEAPASNVFAPANDDGDPATFGAFNWVQSTNMHDKLVAPAAAYGFDHYWIGPVISTGFAMSWVTDLRYNNYPRYLDEIAEHVAAVAIHWRDTYGITPEYLQLFNEPLSGNGELNGGSIAEILDIIKRCGARLRAEGFATMKFVVTAEETEDLSLRDAQMIMADAEARQYVGVIAYHPYPYGSTYASVPNILGSSGAGRPDPAKVLVRNQLRDLGAQYGVPVMMIEVSHSNVDFASFDNVRGRAIQIHDELLYADAAAFFGMNAMWDSTSQAQHYAGRPDPGLYSETDSIVLIDNTTDQVTISPMGRAIGHYARWITRGAVRLEATSDDPLVQVTAFRDDARGKLVLVAINNADTARTIDVSAIAAPMFAGALSGEVSTATEVWKPFAGTTTSSGWTVDVPAHGVASMAAVIPTVAPDGPVGGGDVTVPPGGGPGGGGGCRTGGGGSLGLGVAVLAVLQRRRWYRGA